MQTVSKSFKVLLSVLILLNIVLLSSLSYILLNGSNGMMKAERIDIKDSTGKNRIVISNSNHIPNPIVGGKTFQRAYTPHRNV